MRMSSYTTAQKLRHRARWFKQQVSPPDIAIAGGYHFGNVGDMLLGYTTEQNILRQPGLQRKRIGLQTIYNLPMWPKAKFIIVGGGAVLTDENISKLRNYVRNVPARLAIFGADLLSDEYCQDNIDFLCQLPYLSIRSSKGAQKLSSLGVKGVRIVPDIVFANELITPGTNAKKTAGLNIVPELWGANSAESNTQACSAYRIFMRNLASSFASRGYSLVHLPFSPDDNLAARKILSGLPVTFHQYSSNPLSTKRAMQQFSRFVPSRFHSLILAMLYEIPLIPFLYAEKSECLLDDFFPTLSGITVRDIIERNGSIDGLIEESAVPFSQRSSNQQMSQKVKSDFDLMCQSLHLGRY